MKLTQEGVHGDLERVVMVESPVGYLIAIAAFTAAYASTRPYP